MALYRYAVGKVELIFATGSEIKWILTSTVMPANDGVVSGSNLESLRKVLKRRTKRGVCVCVCLSVYILDRVRPIVKRTITIN